MTQLKLKLNPEQPFANEEDDNVFCEIHPTGLSDYTIRSARGSSRFAQDRLTRSEDVAAAFTEERCAARPKAKYSLSVYDGFDG